MQGHECECRSRRSYVGFEIRNVGVPGHIAAVSAYLVVLLVHLTGQIFAPYSFVTGASQVFLMPALAAILLSVTITPRTRLVNLALIALFFSWIGDTLPRFLSGDAGFLAMMSGFLVAHISYISAFYPYRRQSIISKPLLIVPYLAAAVALVTVCFHGAELFFVPIVLYTAVIVGMAILATGISMTGAIGAIIFLISDSLIALGAFADFSLPGQGFWIMLTYVLGQSLLVHSIVVRDERTRSSFVSTKAKGPATGRPLPGRTM